ncbi:MAG: hypothetical protein WKF81_12035 [Thermomicrobiales bacterium]
MSIKRPARTIDENPVSLGLISRFLRVPGTTAKTGAVIYEDTRIPGMLWELFDSGSSASNLPASGETLFHILYVQNENDSIVEVEDGSWPIHPGDSVCIGGSPHVSISPGVLALLVRSETRSETEFALPSHGIETFDGFNRRTTYEAGEHFSFERWKLTQPQTIEIEANQAAAMVVIFGNISFIADGIVETLGAGESVVCTKKRVRLIPDGLAYIALVLTEVH